MLRHWATETELKLSIFIAVTLTTAESFCSLERACYGERLMLMCTLAGACGRGGSSGVAGGPPAAAVAAAARAQRDRGHRSKVCRVLAAADGLTKLSVGMGPELSMLRSSPTEV